MAIIVSSTPSEIANAAKCLQAGGLIAFPTETVYGLGAVAFDISAISNIFAVKQRPASNPLIVHLCNFQDLFSVAELPRHLKESTLTDLLEAYSPGPLTLVLPKRACVPDIVTAGLNSVAVRFPSHPVARELIRAVNSPIVAPSANIFTHVSPTTAQHVIDEFCDLDLMVLDGGPCEVGIESTVLSLLQPIPAILRPGAVSRAMLNRIFPELLDVNNNVGQLDSPQLSPGQHTKHYSPTTKTILLSQLSDQHHGLKLGLIAFSEGFQHSPQRISLEHVIVLSKDGDLKEISRKLYGALRTLDSMDLDVIAIDSCLEDGLGIAVMDRVYRAVGI